MKKTIKNAAYATAWVWFMALNSANAAINFEWKTINSNLEGSNQSADIVIQDWVATISTFLYIIAVIVILWAGFQILTAAWDEEKTKKWKTIIIQAVVWLLVIFIASSIVNLIINALFSGT